MSAASKGAAPPLLELGRPLVDLELPPGAEGISIAAAFDGERLGTLELPVCGRVVPAAVVADAAADRFSWELLRRFFERRLYPSLRSDPVSWLAARGLADMLSPADVDRLQVEELHDAIGWGVFLQELWGEREPPHTLYGPARAPAGPRGRLLARFRRRRWHRFEVSAEPGPVRGPADVLVSVGGTPLGVVPVERVGQLTPEIVRGAVTSVAGFELCRLAVREGVLGRAAPSGDETDLRERLARAAQAAEDPPPPAGEGQASPGRPGPAPAREPEEVRIEARRGIEQAPGWDRALAAVLEGRSAALIFARHGPDPADGTALGTSTSRRAALPAGAADELLEAARATGEPVVRVGAQEAGDADVLYAPELVWRPRSGRRRGRDRSPRRRRAGRSSSPPPPATAADQRRHRFDEAFAAREDPWRYASAYERTKYELTLSLIPDGRPPRALEVGCAEGHFTAQLAPRVERLTAADISGIALERAARRCEPGTNVDFLRLDLVSDPLPGRFDLVVCSETLYFTGDREGLAATAQKLADAVTPGGHLVTANAHQVADDPGSPGFDWEVPFGAKAIGEALSATGSLSLVRELRAPLYRVQLFRRTGGGVPAPPPEIVEIDQPTEIPEHVAPTVRWSGGRPASAAPGEAGATTSRLPILLYHRVAPSGAMAGARFRVTPEAFEEQLDYLRSAGFRSVGLGAWQRAMEARRPVPGRRVMITFDDGYRDLAEHAWPLLRRYGFGAVVFVVADEVGGWNRWDDHLGERVPLLDWRELARLRDHGLEVGSHSATHRPLTGLSPVEVIREATRSRAEIARRLGEPPLAFAYPYGDTDGAVEHLVGASGYRHGLTVHGVRCRLQDRLLALPRIEVPGGDGLPAFIAKLGR